MDKVIGLHVSFLLAQANGCPCVKNLGAPIQLMGCFEVYPSTCWISSQHMHVG
jgi:hypothetical protein